MRRQLQVHISDVTKLEGLLKFIHRLDADAEQLDSKSTRAGSRYVKQPRDLGP
jgi:hypothetical protein